MPADRDYRLYDPDIDAELGMALGQHAPEEPVSLSEFTTFSAAVACGFQNVCYETQHFQLPDGMVGFFWVTNKHASFLGQALAGRSLASLMLCMTRFEERDGFDEVIRASPGARIDALTISHKSGDEETPASMAAIARAAHHFGCTRLAIWSAEFEPGSLEALAAELVRLDNQSIRQLEICDLTQEEPNDQLRHPDLEAFLARGSRSE